MLAKASRRLLAESPDDPAVIQLLLQQRELKVEDVLRTFRLIVDTRPARIPEAVEAVAPVVTRVRPGDPRRHRETLGEILTAARARLPELPREEAARADRLLTSVESQLNRERQDASARLLRFIEQYQGTQEARLAEVDVIAGGPASQQELDALDAFHRCPPWHHSGGEGALHERLPAGIQRHRDD
jgi:phytoene dehydrogenase-like protein